MFRKVVTTATLAASIACIVPAALHAQAPREALAVRGHWVIEVRNPGGALVERREFDNHLANFGGFALVGLFTRESSLGRFGIELFSSNMSPFGGYRLIYEPSHDGPVSAGNLKHPVVNPGTSAFILSGDTTVDTTGFITKVGSLVTVCAGSRTPRECATNGGSVYSLTEAAITPLPVAPGQVVMVTVTIGFGSMPDAPVQ